jgi:predicted Zn-dependent protease
MNRTKTLNRAIKLWHLGNFGEATALLVPLLSHKPTDPVVNGLLGSICYEAKKYRKAFQYYEVAATASPKSELAIRGRLHAAINLGWRVRAVEAAKILAALTGRKDDIQLLKAVGG